MANQGEKITLASKDGGSFACYLAMPAKLPAPAIVVAQEIFGVNRVMRDTCDALAAQGFIAACPDLFWRIEPGIELDDRVEADMTRAFDLFGKFDVDKGVDDLRAAVHAFKGHAEGNGKVGVVGYCLGGKLAYLMACRSKIDAATGYYGVGLDALLDEAEHITHPLMLHIAEEDKFVPRDAQEKIREALAKNKHVTLHSYPGCDHAFAREGGAHYDAVAAKTANARTYEFFARHLGLEAE
jgi:carboxymethylenebutenolidase